MEDEKAAVRAAVFGHLAGIAMAATTKALFERRVLDSLIVGGSPLDLDTAVEQSRANRGYLRVALRLLASSAWLEQHITENGRHVSYTLTPGGRIALQIAPPLYGDVASFVSKAIFLEDFVFGRTDSPILASLQELARRSKERWGMAPSLDPVVCRVQEQIRAHLDGVVIAPSMVALARSGILAQLAQGPAEIAALPGNRASLGCIFDLLAVQGWVIRQKNTVALTSAGRYAAQIATSYGVTVSYYPLFDNLNILLFGNPRIPRVDDSGVELLVNRAMNVWGSGGAHTTYFKKVDEIIVEIFDRPLNQQPRGICDMGCGDGTFLQHLYQVVKERTERGRVLDKQPLVLVGADFNRVARRVCKQRLRQAGIPGCHVIPGDINRPALLAGDLEEIGVDIHDLLHVRSFLDHNRPIRLRPTTFPANAPRTPPEPLLTWERKFRPTNSRKISCAICGAGHRTWDASAFWCWSCTRCRRSWRPRTSIKLPRSATTARTAIPINIWSSCRSSSTAPKRRAWRPTEDSSRCSRPPNSPPLASISSPRLLPLLPSG